MAEVVGLVLGGISMAALVQTCTQAFDQVESARTYGREYQKSALKLSLLELRLTRWVGSVIETVKQKNIVIGTSEDAEKVRELLGEIAETFQRAERYAVRHKTARPTEGHVNDDDDEEVATVDVLAHRVKTMALHRQKTSSFGQRTRWALLDQRKFKRLLSDLGDSISELETMFPAEQMLMISESRKQRAKAEAMKLIQPSQAEVKDSGVLVSILEDAAADVDQVLNEAVEKAAQDTRIARHTYGEINVADTVRISVGDYIAPGQQQSGPGHTYGRLTATGSSRVLYGDNFGGRSVFDD